MVSGRNLMNVIPIILSPDPKQRKYPAETSTLRCEAQKIALLQAVDDGTGDKQTGQI